MIMAKEIKGWFTKNGKHIPIYDGESMGDSQNRTVAILNEEKKQSDIAQSKMQSQKAIGALTDEQSKILNTLRTSSEVASQAAGEKYKGYISKTNVIDYFRDGEDVFESVGWSKRNNDYATNYTTKDDYEVRYVRNGKVYTREQATKMAEEMFNRMVQKGFLELSKSGKGVRVSKKYM